ncbi:MGR1 Mitochondrial inner membrane i-AAA protease complex subunit MGR1 [Candida maltosa Xu316]|uniref:Mitochondrial inner membrane i-AAA protease complex subunit MGR1 n=1 Tax=Candida maltosa (strain Xu316) TaxID=1245528 RepID=M3JFK7_CANMX|nr:Mitochondrial inner membrane i-AAA protease complex subunit MGR1 [Candida maltosa Xu316]
MGVYIPPPNDKDEGDKKNVSKNSNSNSSSSSSSSSSSPGSTTIMIPNPAGLIPHNPKVGLIWGPLTPASDNRPALFSMIGLQFIIGCGFFKHARTLSRLRPMGGYQVPNVAPKMVRTGSMWRIVLSALAGTALSFGSGLELCRVTLPYDPWYEEAKHYRRMAIKNGDKPSSWFGAYNYYRPMDFNAWSDKVEDWIKNVEREISSDDPDNFANLSVELGKSSNVINVHRQQQQGGGVLSKLNNKGKYLEIYNRLTENNDRRWKELLDTDLRDVDEINKGERLDLILEGKSDLVNPNFTKSALILGNHTIDDDDKFEMVWLNFEPWDELKIDTEYDIRLIPSSMREVTEQEESDDNGPADVTTAQPV